MIRHGLMQQHKRATGQKKIFLPSNRTLTLLVLHLSVRILLLYVWYMYVCIKYQQNPRRLLGGHTHCFI